MKLYGLIAAALILATYTAALAVTKWKEHRSRQQRRAMQRAGRAPNNKQERTR